MMCLVVKYFVLALLFVVTASVPYTVPRYREHQNINPGPYQNRNAAQNIRNPEIQRWNQHSNFPRNQPTYMSPVPTVRDAPLHNEGLPEISKAQNAQTSVITQPVNLPSQRQLNNPSNKYEPQKPHFLDRQSEINIIHRLNRQNHLVTQENDLASTQMINKLTNQNRPIVNNNENAPTHRIQRPPFSEVMERNRFPLNKVPGFNSYSRNLPPMNNNNGAKPLIIEENSKLKTVQERLRVNPHFFKLNTGYPVLNNNNNQIKQAANHMTEQSQLEKPLLNIPINKQQTTREHIEVINRGQQILKPKLNQIPAAVPQNYKLEHFLSNKRIRDVLSKTKHKKRFLVIHSDGTVEHLDTLEPIIQKHPNYLLVKAGDIVPSRYPSPNTAEKTKANLKPQFPTPVQSSKKNIITKPDDNGQKLELEQAQINQPKLQTSIINDVANVVPPPVQTSVISKIDKVDKILEKAEIELSQVAESQSNPPDSPEEPKLPTSVLSEFDTESLSLTAQESDFDLVQTVDVPTSTNILIETENSLERQPPTTLNPIDIIENNVQTEIEEFKLPEVKQIENIPESPVIVETIQGTEISELPNSEDILDAEILNKQKDVDAAVSSIVNDNAAIYSEETGGNEEADILTPNSVEKPSVYYTSDPNFWDEVSGGEDPNVIYFFEVKNQPKIEKDTVRTVYPNGTIVEEITESIWEHPYDLEPKVTKTTNVIHSEDL